MTPARLALTFLTVAASLLPAAARVASGETTRLEVVPV